MIAVLFATGFEEVEALASVDILRRAGLAVDAIGVTGKNVTGAHGITIIADKTAADSRVSDYRAVVLPGGLLGTQNLDSDPFTEELISHVLKTGGHIGAICAAPTILGKRGLLRGKRAICYPGMEDALDGAIIVNAPAVTDGNITTGRNMEAAVDFAKELAAVLAK